LSVAEALAASNSSKHIDGDSEKGRIKMMNFLETMQPPPVFGDATPLTGRATLKAPLRTLYDHGHNNRNKMVIYDDEPRIEAVMKAALDRHDKKVKEHEQFIVKTKEKQLELNDVASRHSELKKHEVENHRDQVNYELQQ